MDVDDLRAVVLTYGGGDDHLPLVRCLLDEGVRAERLVLVHNPSADAGGPASPPGAAVVRMGRNVGYGGAMNAAVDVALRDGSAFVLLLTHDARLRAGTVAALLKAARAAPEFGVLGPVLWSRSDGAPWSYGGTGAPWRPGVHRRAPRPDDDAVVECDWVDGAAMLVRREVFDRVGGFDERYFMYLEEPDLCLRARRAGWRVGVVTDAWAEQEPGAPRRPGAYSYLLMRNGLEFARRSEGIGAILYLLGAKAALAWGLAKWRVKEHHDAVVRDEVRAHLVGMSMGLADFARGRWGPPPRWLPGMGDLDATPTATRAGRDG